MGTETPPDLSPADYRAIIAGLVSMLDTIGEHEGTWPGVDDAMNTLYDRALLAIGGDVTPQYRLVGPTGAWSRWDGGAWEDCPDPRTIEEWEASARRSTAAFASRLSPTT